MLKYNISEVERHGFLSQVSQCFHQALLSPHRPRKRRATALTDCPEEKAKLPLEEMWSGQLLPGTTGFSHRPSPRRMLVGFQVCLPSGRMGLQGLWEPSVQQLVDGLERPQDLLIVSRPNTVWSDK